MGRARKRLQGATAATVAAAAALACVSAGAGAAGTAAKPRAVVKPRTTQPAPAELRLDQVGFLPTDTKIGYLMTGGAVADETWAVQDSSGSTVASGQIGASASRGSWSTAYPDVYPLDFSSVTAPGTYTLSVAGPVNATSTPFQIEDAHALYGPLVTDGVNFFENQRDGADVIPGALDRRPSHLNDEHATVYATPRFRPNGSDVIVGTLRPIGGPVDVEGGWFDAGDYLKFTFTAAYADSLLYEAARALGSAAPAALTTEAQYGTQWLDKMWQPSTRTLYLQVGIGSGNETTFYGDHDLWRLPETDDANTVAADRFATTARPVFEAASPGSRIAPDIAGRVAAAFALAAQADAGSDRSAATAQLERATSLYALANTHPTGTLGSTLPTAYYPESIWHDAMELAATEIVLAELDLGAPASTYGPYLRQAARWAADYIAHDSGADTLNLYDVSALAHADLIAAIHRAGDPPGLAVTVADLEANLKAQVTAGAAAAAGSIFRLGGDETAFDVDSHTFGLISIEALYARVTGDQQFAAFASEQRDWLLGGNPWGESFMVGVGHVFPECMQSQIPNLAGSLDGRPPIDTGAVVNGPNNPSNFTGGLGGLQTGMRSCENDGGTAFTGQDSEFVDDVRAWQTDEPALDMTGSAILAGALQSSLAGGAGAHSAASRHARALP